MFCAQIRLLRSINWNRVFTRRCRNVFTFTAPRSQCPLCFSHPERLRAGFNAPADYLRSFIITFSSNFLLIWLKNIRNTVGFAKIDRGNNPERLIIALICIGGEAGIASSQYEVSENQVKENEEEKENESFDNIGAIPLTIVINNVLKLYK